MTTRHFLPALLAGLALATGLAGCQRSAEPASAGAAAPAAAKPKFHCPMHPTYVSDRLGDCPICGMSLVTISGGGEHAAHGGVPGRATIQLTGEKRQLIGLTFGTVETRDLAVTVRAPAIVRHDERRYARIAPRFGGWVKTLAVNFNSAPVTQGEPLFTAYSPELYATENDYLIAWRALRSLPEEASATQREAAQALLDAARTRLELWEIGADEIRAIEERGAPGTELVYRAPFSGHVIAKNAVEGKAFMAGETLFEIADLSRLWVIASVTENELPRIAAGQEVMLTFPSLGNLVVAAEVTFVDPHLDPQTRRGQVRIDLDNPGHRLPLEAWGEAEIEISLGRKLTVPAAAVIDTGRRAIAFVDGEKHHLEPRVVKLGARTDDFYEVKDGLREGERVVSRALFLVDSESQLRAAIAALAETAGHQH